MGHFKITMLEVHSLEPSIAMLALKRGLDGGSFYFSPSKKFSWSIPELLARVEKYINTKKDMVEKQKEKEIKNILKSRAINGSGVDPRPTGI